MLNQPRHYNPKDVPFVDPIDLMLRVNKWTDQGRVPKFNGTPLVLNRIQAMSQEALVDIYDATGLSKVLGRG